MTSSWDQARQFWQTRLAELAHIRTRRVQAPPTPSTATGEAAHLAQLGCRRPRPGPGQGDRPPRIPAHRPATPRVLFDDLPVFEAWVRHHTDNYRGMR